MQTPVESIKRFPNELMNNRWGYALVQLLIGLTVTALLLLISNYFSKTNIGEWLLRSLYEREQMILAQKKYEGDLPVVVIDLSDMDLTPNPHDPTQKKITSREHLRTILELIARKEPKVIGIDIDFGGEYGFTKVTGDTAFFDFCQRLNVPVILGVHRSLIYDPNRWLGPSKYANLGATIGYKDANPYMIKWMEVESKRYFSLGAKMADYFQPRGWTPPDFLKPLLKSEIERSVDDGLLISEFPVNFGIFPEIKKSTVRIGKPTDKLTETELQNLSKEYLKGKAVLLTGAGDNADDKFSLTISDKPVEGVYLHACAIYTLVNSPLYELTKKAHYLIDLGFAGVLLIGMFSLRVIFGERLEEHKTEWHLQVYLALFALVIGFTIIYFYPIIWHGFVIVAVALLFHSYFEKLLIRRMSSVKDVLRKIVVFAEDREGNNLNGTKGEKGRQQEEVRRMEQAATPQAVIETAAPAEAKDATAEVAAETSVEKGEAK